MRILIVAPNISTRMGGEAILPYHYIRELRKLGHEVCALTHARVRDELLGGDLGGEDLHFVEDSRVERILHRFSQHAPAAIAEPLFGTGVAAVTMARLAARARELCRELSIDVVHQPTPVSPLFPSFFTGLCAPLVVGPLNGAMSYPPALRSAYSRGSETAVRIVRGISSVANRLVAGKYEAARVLVANQRTRRGLPAGIPDERIAYLAENGVDLSLWTAPPVARATPPLFVYVGRLVRWKAVDLAIEAFARMQAPGKLVIVGDGEERTKLEQLAAQRRCPSREIEILGFQKQPAIRDVLARATALVLPSLRECGGAVVLEAFACRTPVIATAWGGPREYVTPETGFLVAPEGREEFIRGLMAAMQAMSANPQSADRMGAAARERAEAHFAWDKKATAMIEIYNAVIAERGRSVAVERVDADARA
jgi:glycosyltransferase involved in cell wall biosynthesis